METCLFGSSLGEGVGVGVGVGEVGEDDAVGVGEGVFGVWFDSLNMEQ